MPATDTLDCNLTGAEPDTNGVANLQTVTLKPWNASPAMRVPQHQQQQQLATFGSLPNRRQHERFFRDSVEILLSEAVFDGTSRDEPVLRWHHPADLIELLDLAVRPLAATHDELLALLRSVVRHSVKTGHPYFANQLFSTVDAYGLIGQWLTDALNASVYTYEVAPVFTLMEDVILREMRTIVGFDGGDGDGIFCPGGSIANGYAINCARYKFLPDIKENGLHCLPRLVLFTSQDAHYSVMKMSSFLGIGSKNVYQIRTDQNGCMLIGHLIEEIDRALLEGAAPFMVIATAGTTVFGAFDPINDIADVCTKYGVWLHVDAAWGGGALMSKKHRGLLAGLQRSDSVTWNPHKMLCVPQQCSTLLLRHRNVLNGAHSVNAAYLFQKDKFYNVEYDTGDKHIQCGRRADVLKFWFMWKAKGTDGLERHVDTVFENAQHFTALIRNHPGFRMVLDRTQCTNICFWYIPQRLRSALPPNTNAILSDSSYREDLHRIAPALKERMMKEGTMMVSYQAHNKLPNFFRMVFQNSGLDKADMLHLVEEFDRLGKDL